MARTRNKTKTNTKTTNKRGGPKPAFSLQDEAFNTRRLHSAWTASSNLRHKTVSFVSAGRLPPTGTELLRDGESSAAGDGTADDEGDADSDGGVGAGASAGASASAGAGAGAGAGGAGVDIAGEEVAHGDDGIDIRMGQPSLSGQLPHITDNSLSLPNIAQKASASSTTSVTRATQTPPSSVTTSVQLEPPPVSFIVDTRPSPALRPKIPPPKIPHRSPTPSSEEDEVVFKGRHAPIPVRSQIAPAARPPHSQRRSVLSKREKERREDERLALEDYAENMRRQEEEESEQEVGLTQSTFKLRNLDINDAMDCSSSPFQGDSSESQGIGDYFKLFHDGDSSQLDVKDIPDEDKSIGSDDMSISDKSGDEEMGARLVNDDDAFVELWIQAQEDHAIARLFQEQEKRGIRSSSLQLFFLDLDQLDGITGAVAAAAVSRIEADDRFQNRFIVTRDVFLAVHRPNIPHNGKLPVASADSDSDSIDYDSDDALSDELAIRNIARQDWIGATKLHGARSKGKMRQRSDFPNASLLADVLEQDPYGGFDVMDVDRPSLRPKKKGRKFEDAIPYELSDADLNAQMRSTWEKDRDKKRLKKAEREELRAQGLLGRDKRDTDKAELKEKYPDGIDIRQIRDEFMHFMASSQDTMALPPMAKHDRMLMHELGMAFGLKSKSVGHGSARAPLFIKTRRSSFFSEDVFMEVCCDSQRGFFPRLQHQASKFRGKAGKGPARKQVTLAATAAAAGGEGEGRGSAKVRRGWGGGVARGVSYSHGDVVGATAPEIGVGNRGHAMLAKMGWNKGQALGKEGSGGILQPITHVIRTGKAGLG